MNPINGYNGTVTNTTETSQKGAASTYYVIPKEIVSLYKDILYFGAIPIIVIAGLILNSMCCVMFYKIKNKSSTVFLLLGLAIADIHSILNAGVIVLMYSSQKYGVPFSKEQEVLSIPYFASFISTIPARTVNLLTLFISLERMLCVLIPMKIRRLSTKKTSILAIIVSYTVSILCSLPFMFFYEADTKYSNTTGSYVTFIKSTGLAENAYIADGLYISMEVMVRFLPFVGVTISSSVTAIVVIIKARRRSAFAEVNIKSKAFGHEKQVTKTLLIITFIYVLCQLPGTILRMVVFFDPESTPYRYKNNTFEVAQTTSFLILLINSVVNFFIYIKTSSIYNELFKEICGHVRIENERRIFSRH